MEKTRDGGKLFNVLLREPIRCKKIILSPLSLGWNAWQAQKSAQEMYDRIFNMKFLPPGRGLWVNGKVTEEKGLYGTK